jgi:hypothetical protein
MTSAYEPLTGQASVTSAADKAKTAANPTGTLTEVAVASAEAIVANGNRDRAIRKAHTKGKHTIRAIAHAAGISPSRVHQIIHGR